MLKDCAVRQAEEIGGSVSIWETGVQSAGFSRPFALGKEPDESQYYKHLANCDASGLASGLSWQRKCRRNEQKGRPDSCRTGPSYFGGAHSKSTGEVTPLCLGREAPSGFADSERC